MALTDKNIIITPATSTSGQPSIKFTGGSATASVSTITFKVLDTGPVSIEGSSGQLMSIIDTNTGTIFSVNDISGIPSIELLDSGLLKLSQYNGNVWIGTNTNTTTTGLSVGGIINASGLTITGNKAVNGPAFSYYPNSGVTQTITSGSQQKILFQIKDYDTDNTFSSSRFTPTVAGYYQLNATVRLDGAVGTGESMIVIWKNGSEYRRGWNSSGVQFASNFWSMSVSTQAYANGTTDYFEVYVQQVSGSSVTVTVAGGNITWFNGAMVRGA